MHMPWRTRHTFNTPAAHLVAHEGAAWQILDIIDFAAQAAPGSACEKLGFQEGADPMGQFGGQFEVNSGQFGSIRNTFDFAAQRPLLKTI